MDNGQDRQRGESEQRQLPVAKNEDVEFTIEAADEEDREAYARMQAADKRQE